MRNIVLLSAVGAVAIGYTRNEPLDPPAIRAPSACDTFTAAAQMMRLGYASSHPFRDDAQIQRAKALLWTYPGGCEDATFHHVATRLILSGEGRATAHDVLRWGRAELSAPYVDAVTFESYRTLFNLMSGRGLLNRIDWRAATDPPLLREQFFEARVR
ncbi:MAG: hypothetical protein RMA76_29765 [Deltaproteobacteria bacterium]|jgi:hypothetical protein